MDDYELTLDQIKQALNYCATLQCKSDNPSKFCHNCSLESARAGPMNTADLEEIISGDSIFVRGKNFHFPGSMAELLEDYRGYDWWLIATDLLIDLRNELRGAPARS